MTPEEILNLPMPSNDAEAETVRDYLKALLTELWRGDSFNEHKPFGYIGWRTEFTMALEAAGVIEPGDDIRAAHLIFDAIKAL
ncbi:hypothetical protein [Emcibacter sp.]|uniref:hypothetical protein n=1 Tax=Emcibacter sp. TaxID=1979954 RepID=UPI002AA7B8B5|nr:hypothetical protein [Emcibacter sp.]